MERIKKLLRPLVNRIRTLKANHRLKKKFTIENKIKVVFICQCQHIWDKQKSVAKMLSNTSKYDVTLLIVADNGVIDNTIFEQYAIKNNIKYKKYYKNVLKDIKPNIIFYSRPYDVWLPNDIKTKNTVKFAKCIYIPYGYSFMKLGNVNLDYSFIRNISLLIADTTYAHNEFVRKCKKNIDRRRQFSVDFGYPYLEDLYLNLNEYLNSKNQFDCFSTNRINVLWTPRWVVEDRLGGSNFFRYIDDIFGFLIDNKNYNFVFRPHPYALTNFVNNGLMTKEKRDYYIDSLKNSSNSIYDSNSEYLNTFFNTDVLITDVSSIIAEFMLTKKPIIFCHNESNEILNDFTLECCQNAFYNAYSFEEIKKILLDLKNGIDPLKEKRELFFDNFIKHFIGTNERILNLLGDMEKEWFK